MSTPAPTAAAVPTAASQKVGWLELFYDLVYVTLVAAVTRLLHDDPSLGRMGIAFGLLVVVWTVWFNEVQATNLARGISPRNRLFVLASMAGVAVMAVGVPELVEGEYLTFTIGYALARVAMAPVWIDQQRLTGIDATSTALVGPLVVLAAAVAHTVGDQRIFWLGVVALEVGRTIVRRRGGDGPRRVRRAERREQRRAAREAGLGAARFDSGHLLERIGLFVLICFGESVAQIVAATSAHRSTGVWVVAGLGLLLVGTLFWAFYDVALQRVEHALEQAPERLREVLGFAQIAIVAGILGVAAGLAGAIGHGGGQLTTSPLRLLAGGTALAMVGLLSMSMDALRILVTSAGGPPPQRRPGGPGLLVLLALSAAEAFAGPVVVLLWGAAMPGWLVLVLLATGPGVMVLRGGIRRDAPRDGASPGGEVSGRP